MTELLLIGALSVAGYLAVRMLISTTTERHRANRGESENWGWDR